MGCAVCKSVKNIEDNTAALKLTLEATQLTLNEAEAKVRVLESSLTSLTEQVTDVRTDLSRLVAMIEEQVPRLATSVTAMQEASSAGIAGVVSSAGNSIGGLFSGPWRTPSIEITPPEPPTMSVTIEGPKRNGEKKGPAPGARKGPPPPAETEVTGPADGASAPSSEEKGEGGASEPAPADPPKKKVVKKVVKKVAAAPDASEE